MLAAHAHIRVCLSCGKALKGRSDKKFCDDYCRNNYNNQLKASDTNLMRNINNTLRKNRRILESFLKDKEETIKMKKERFSQAGFEFKYFTHIYRNKKGTLYYFCYDYGYLPLDNDWILVVKRNDANQ